MNHDEWIKACREGELSTVKKGLMEGCTPERLDEKGRTALMNACMERQGEVTLLLIHQARNLDAQDHEGFTALMHSVDNFDTISIKALIRAGADLNVKNNKGETALWRLMDQRAVSPEWVEWLMKEGARVDDVEIQGKKLTQKIEEMYGQPIFKAAEKSSLVSQPGQKVSFL